MSDFAGFPPELFSFFEGLARDNSKAYWRAHEEIWRAHVRQPLQALLTDLADEFGPLRMFRPNRDVRFTKDKSPYKLWAGATSAAQARGGIGYHLEVSASGLVVGFGAMAMDRDQLQRFRHAIDDPTSGATLETILTALADRSLPVIPGAEPPLKRLPTGYPAEHHRAELLCWKGVAVVREDPRADWMHTTAVLATTRQVWRAAQPLRAWLDAHVGPVEEVTTSTAARRS